MAGHRRAEATPFIERLCPAMTKVRASLDFASQRSRNDSKYGEYKNAPGDGQGRFV